MAQLDTTGDNARELRKSNIGIRMTVLYAIVYGGFVALNVFKPTMMGMPVFFGLNLAVAYGIGLIIVAIIFALIYNQLSSVKSNGKERYSSLDQAGLDIHGRKQ